MGLDAVNHCNHLELKQFGSNIHPGVTPLPAPAFHLLYLSSGVALLLLLVIGKVCGVGGGYLLMDLTKECAVLGLFLFVIMSVLFLANFYCS